MSTISILVAEDDTNIRMGLVDILESEAYSVTQAGAGEAALALFKKKAFDLVLLDIMMPEKSGYDVCREIRSMDRQIPIIMLTAKSEEMDKVIGLHSGADDYITKPFGIHELLARITAVLRRSRLGKENEQNLVCKEVVSHESIFSFGEYQVNPKTFKIFLKSLEPMSQPSTRSAPQSIEIDLSKRELTLIQLFYQHPGEVLSRDTLLNEIWGINYFSTTRTLDQHIAKLRKKIEINPANPKIITTVHGVGYRYEGDL